MASNKEKLETPEYKARLLAFSERLKKKREELDITQSALAERAGLSGHAVISRWEAVANPVRGGDFTSPGAAARELPDVNDMLKLCAVFDCEIDYLVGTQDFPKKKTVDICKETRLAPGAVETLILHAKSAIIDDIFRVETQSDSYYQLMAVNHLVANCNSALVQIGLYLFGEFEDMPEKVRIKGANITLSQVDEYTRRGMLETLCNELMEYRAQLQSNGGDLPLDGVIKKTREDSKNAFVKARVEHLEKLREHSLTEDEIVEQGEIWERSQQKTTAELVREIDEAVQRTVDNETEKYGDTIPNIIKSGKAVNKES